MGLDSLGNLMPFGLPKVSGANWFWFAIFLVIVGVACAGLWFYLYKRKHNHSVEITEFRANSTDNNPMPYKTYHDLGGTFRREGIDKFKLFKRGGAKLPAPLSHQIHSDGVVRLAKFKDGSYRYMTRKFLVKHKKGNPSGKELELDEVSIKDLIDPEAGNVEAFEAYGNNAYQELLAKKDWKQYVIPLALTGGLVVLWIVSIIFLSKKF